MDGCERETCVVQVKRKRTFKPAHLVSNLTRKYLTDSGSDARCTHLGTYLINSIQGVKQWSSLQLLLNPFWCRDDALI